MRSTMTRTKGARCSPQPTSWPRSGRRTVRALPTDVRVVLMTAPDPATAERLGATLVEERLATCANVLPALSSVYWWQGKVERANESLLLLKTVEARVPALR